MTRDVEELLRRVAGRDGPNPAHYRELRSLLQDRIAASSVIRRRLSRTAAVFAVVCLLFVVLASWRDVGTDDFGVVPGWLNPPGGVSFQHSVGRRTDQVGFAADSRLSGERQRQLAEEILQKSAANEGELIAIDGSTVDGVTGLAATYAIDTAEGTEEVTQELAVPFAKSEKMPFPDPPTRFHMAYGYSARVRLTEGPTAQYIGRIDFMVDARPAYCDRWRVPVPGFGDVIIWRGAPYP